MELDDLKSAWETQACALDKSMRLNAVLLNRMNLGTVERRIGTTLFGVVVQLCVDALAVLLVGSFAADHAADPRYLIPAVILGAFAIGLAADTVAQLVAIGMLDYDGPVALIQQRLLRLRAQRIRRVMFELALAPLMWVPLTIVAARGIFGVDVYAALGVPYIAANAALGVGVLLGAVAVAKHLPHWFERHSSVRSLLDDISGRSLTRALESLDSLERFVNVLD
jgi:hypothetical protein